MKKYIYIFSILSIFLLGFIIKIDKINGQSSATPFKSFGAGNSSLHITGSCTGDYKEWGSQPFTFSQTGYVDTFVISPSIRKVGNPNDSFRLSIFKNSVDGTLITSTDISANNISTGSTTSTVFSFNVPITVTSTANQYAFLLSRTGEASTSSYYIAPINTATGTTHLVLRGNDVNNCNSTNDNINYFVGTVYGTTTGYQGTLQFLLPQNGQTGRDFSSFYFGLGAISLDNTSLATVRYGPVSSTLIYTNTSTPVIGTSNGHFDYFIPKTRNLADGTWYALGTITDINGDVAETGLISFTINHLATTTFAEQINVNGYVFEYPFTEPSSTVETCSPTDIGACLINVFAWVMDKLFVPTTSFDAIINDAMDSFQSLFPFSVPLTILEQIEIDSATSTQTLTTNLPMPFGNTNISIISSSTLSNVVSSAGKNSLFDAMRAFMWIGAGILMVVSIAGFNKS